MKPERRQKRKLRQMIENPPQWLERYAQKMEGRMTPAEAHLWERLRSREGWRSQTSIKQWIVDFYHPELRLAIEVDGGIHTTSEQILKDKRKDAGLFYLGVVVLRFVNKQVLDDVESVMKAITQYKKS